MKPVRTLLTNDHNCSNSDPSLKPLLSDLSSQELIELVQQQQRQIDALNTDLQALTSQRPARPNQQSVFSKVLQAGKRPFQQLYARWLRWFDRWRTGEPSIIAATPIALQEIDVETQTLVPAGICQFRSAKTIPVIERGFRHTSRPTLNTCVYKIKNGRVLTYEGWILTEDNRPITDFSLSQPHPAIDFLKNCATTHPNSGYPRLKLQEIDARIAVLAGGPGHVNFYHWMFEVLPRLGLIQKSGYELDYYFVTCKLPFQKESFALLGIPDSQIIQAELDSFIAAREIIVPSVFNQFDIIHSPLTNSHFLQTRHIPRWACEFLRESLLPKAKQLGNHTTQPYSEYLYITRQRAAYRQVVNEAEIIPYLESVGFQVIALEDLSFVDQILLFQQAKIVIAPHGAGNSHWVFCQPGTVVIELFSPAYPMNLFWQVSNQVGMDYYYLICDRAIALEPDPLYPAHTENMRVRLDSLKQILSPVLAA